MKRISLFLAMAAMVAFVACGSSESEAETEAAVEGLMEDAEGALDAAMEEATMGDVEEAPADTAAVEGADSTMTEEGDMMDGEGDMMDEEDGE